MDDEKTIISASTDYTIKIWNYVTSTVIHTFKDHTSAVTCLGTLNCNNLSYYYFSLKIFYEWIP